MQDVVELFMSPNPFESPNAHYMEPSRREWLAEKINVDLLRTLPESPNWLDSHTGFYKSNAKDTLRTLLQHLHRIKDACIRETTKEKDFRQVMRYIASHPGP